MSDFTQIAAAIAQATGEPFAPRHSQSIGGGCINQALVLADGRRRFFLKLNEADRVDMFEAEAAGLAEMAEVGAIRVPQAICVGVSDARAYLVLEHIEFGSGGRETAAELGRCLARMHRHTQAQFGWHRDNTIGATPQINSADDDWVRFWRERRLGFQYRLAAGKGYGGELQRRGEQLMLGLEAFFTDYHPPPSLLHGDLWSGNQAADSQGNPVIFDPAVYYGDREADLAMTELFGGFGRGFFSAYNEVWPVDAGYTVRRDLYNLYHILNHLNLFGGGYLSQAESMTARLLAELH